MILRFLTIQPYPAGNAVCIPKIIRYGWMDLEGTNITYVNNEKVTKDVIVHSGDVISFGNADYYITIK